MKKIEKNKKAQQMIIQSWKDHLNYMDYRLAKKLKRQLRTTLKLKVDALDILEWVSHDVRARCISPLF